MLQLYYYNITIKIKISNYNILRITEDVTNELLVSSNMQLIIIMI